MQVVFVFAFSVLLCGCGTAYQIELVEDNIYLEFEKDDRVKVGDVFTLYTTSTFKQNTGRPAPPRYKKVIVGRVRVTKIADETHAVVAVLEGQIKPGLKAEKSEGGD